MHHEVRLALESDRPRVTPDDRTGTSPNPGPRHERTARCLRKARASRPGPLPITPVYSEPGRPARFSLSSPGAGLTAWAYHDNASLLRTGPPGPVLPVIATPVPHRTGPVNTNPSAHTREPTFVARFARTPQRGDSPQNPHPRTTIADKGQEPERRPPKNLTPPAHPQGPVGARTRSPARRSRPSPAGATSVSRPRARRNA